MKVLVNHTAQVRGTAATSEDYAFLQDYVYRRSGIVLDNDKQYLMDARLGPVLRKCGLSTMGDLCNLLRGTVSPQSAINRHQVHQDVVEAMTTNETLFFREPSQFEALRTCILPELRTARGGARIRIWSAAASTGQEAYSVAMMLLDMGWTEQDFEILGTDLNQTVLDRAAQGSYLQIEVNRGLPAQRLVKYFDRSGLEWQLKPHVRKLVHFRQFDLRESMSGLGSFDLILCRNVLIYFDAQTKRRILSNIRGAIASEGYLLLGGAEATNNVGEFFRSQEVGSVTVYRSI